MPTRPNILFLMTDQMQARVLESGHVCQTPHLDRLASRGIRFRRAYSPNAVCSPSRASLMTGLLPHNHGVETVTGDVAPDKCTLCNSPHWAQRLVEAGYRTGYFGKWHVELSERAGNFGWQVDGGYHGPRMEAVLTAARERVHNSEFSLARYHNTPGYARLLHYGVTPIPPEERQMGLITDDAMHFLGEAWQADQPWCCFVSFFEPHDPYIAGQAAFDRIAVDDLPLPPNVHDTLEGRPGAYRKLANVWKSMSDREHREARACYFASITELDGQFGRVLDALEHSGQLDNTIIVMTADHGDLMGAHGMYAKGYTAAEEIYNVPLIVAGPGMAANTTTDALVGSHDLCPTLLELTGNQPFNIADSRSFAPLLKSPASQATNFTTAYAEYHGSRIPMLQRIAWQGNFKYILNGFDFDELYDLASDPFEMKNLIDQPEYQNIAQDLLTLIWQRARATGDLLIRAQYPMWRIASHGPIST
ncbi:MAG: sulfatase-like hydrolase/transferase [Phycisphaerales bacterium]|nr:sulfatase-like hydrolase/transferase [Phycisphaerales bacterium]